MADDSSQEDSSSARKHHVSYRRARAARACEVCHSRKVRCDVTNRMPCTNCIAFGCECKIPSFRRRKANEKLPKESTDEKPSAASTGNNSSPPLDSSKRRSHSVSSNHASSSEGENDADSFSPNKVQKTDERLNGSKTQNLNLDSKSEGHRIASNEDTEAWVHLLSSSVEGNRSVRRSGRVAYLGSSSNLSLLVQSKAGNTEVCHYPLPDELRVGASRLNELDKEEIEILHRRGAFLLPPRDICDELVECFFDKIHPIVPLINRTQFMSRYNDSKNPPSLLLLQSILLAGTRVCKNPALLDQNGSADLASLTLYKRAKALYDANYEDDRISIVQSLTLLGWWWEGPEDVTKNVFYWTRVALCVAQGFGLHRSVENSQLSIVDKRLWKRLWWVLFSRDRQVAIALGRPVLINTDDTDVPMLTEEDFIEEEGAGPYEYPPCKLHVQYFIQSLKLSEIMGLVLRQQFSVASETSRVANRGPDITHSDMALGAWMSNLPVDLRYYVNDKSRHNFFKALIHLQYYTILCLLHRTNMSQTRQTPNVVGNSYLKSYPSRSIAFQAAHMISRIVHNMSLANELRDAPAFTVYTIFSAMIMLVYQTKSQSQQIVDSAQKSLDVCMAALAEVGKSWMVGKMILRLFEKINQSKRMKDRIFRAVNPRQQHQQQVNIRPPGNDLNNDPSIDEGIFPGSIEKSIFYQNSRSATPTGTNSSSVFSQSQSDLGSTVQPEPLAPPAIPHQRRHNEDSYFPPQPHSARSTAPPTPGQFAASFSIPGTPPDFFLVTQSPPISQTFVENFQPSQLFPEDEIKALTAEYLQVHQNTSIDVDGTKKNVDWSSAEAALVAAAATAAAAAAAAAGGSTETPPGAGKGIAPSLSKPTPSIPSSAPVFFPDLEVEPNSPEENNHSTTGSTTENDGSVPSGNDSKLHNVPNSLNIGDWYNFLASNTAGEAFNEEFAELAQSSGFSLPF
ncbi:fungal-specific transcription factor domain-containing protein [Lipomyces japonicus]|uniref:fungal-specific transcription factor domain-containing protein n=1 Tax=Lipomyces japonicus TaxID=56871 RepID=UPI0034CE9569